MVLWSLASSGAGIIFLALLFAFEARRGSRVASPIRDWLDSVADKSIVLWHTSMLYVGSGAARVGLHYLLHRVLRVCGRCLQWLYERVEYWRRRNRRIARTVQAARTETHLTAIVEHKHATALTEKQKIKLKAQRLEG